MNINVAQITQVTDEVVTAFQRLVPQLSSSASCPTKDDLTRIVSSPAIILLAARDTDRDNKIVGALTLALFRIPTGMRAWIEDLVVDSTARGKGVGEALCRAAVQHARDAGAVTVDLTSRPAREAANRLYRRLGFKERDTNVYRYDCKNQPA